MKLQRREKILLAVVAGLLIGGLGWFLVAGDSGSVEKLTAKRDSLIADKERKQNSLADSQRAAKQLAEWNRRALPSDPVKYSDWLSKLGARFIKSFKLEANKTSQTRGGEVATRFSFTLTGRTSLDNLTKFLYEFYSAGHLHQIRRMDIRPVGQNSRELEVINLTIEALSLPGTNRKVLSEEKGKGLQQGKNLDDYVQTITKRDLFAPFVPRGPQRTVDLAQYAVVTGIVEDRKVPQVWLQDRLTGKQWKLNEGDSFQIGETSGKVRKISPPHEVILEFDNHRRKLREGDNLRGGVEVRDKD